MEWDQDMYQILGQLDWDPGIDTYWDLKHFYF